MTDAPPLDAGSIPAGHPRTHSAHWLIPLIVVIVDQITKWSVALSMRLNDSIPVVGDWFRLTYILNPGGAFGVRWGHQGLYFAAAAVVIAWIAWHLWHHGYSVHLSSVALALILGGAIGNMIDRVILGQVIDFLDFEFPDMRIPQFDFGLVRHPGMLMDRWPIFNIADSAVSVGVVTLVVSLFYDPRIAGVHLSNSQPDLDDSETIVEPPA